MRVVDRLLSVVLALALLLVGLAVAAEVAHTALGRPGYLLVPWPAAAARAGGHAFSDPAVLAIGAAVGVVGLVLLGTELRRRRPALLVVRPGADGAGVVCAVSRSSVGRALAARAQDVDGVRGASARLRRRRADVVAVTALRDPGNIQDEVTETVSDWLGGLGLVAPPRPRVRLKRKASS